MNKLCLENQLCFKLYALSRQMTARYRPLLEKLDITYPQYLVMLVLWEMRIVTVKELGNKLYLDSGTLTPLLKRLEQKEFITRKRDPADERSVVIALANAGKALQQKAKKVPDTFGQCMTMDADEFTKLKTQLDQLIGQLTTE